MGRRPERYASGERYLLRSVGEAMNSVYYPLVRFWVLGCGMAERMARDFELLNLVRSGKAKEIEEDFGGYIAESDRRRSLRLTRQEICEFIDRAVPESSDRDRKGWYFENRTIGCKKAFAVL
jgi:hypothetical protein